MIPDFDLSRYPIPNKLFIHGEWVDSQGGQTKSFKSIVTGQSLPKGIYTTTAYT
jgi:hypothetical protein